MRVDILFNYMGNEIRPKEDVAGSDLLSPGVSKDDGVLSLRLTIKFKLLFKTLISKTVIQIEVKSSQHYLALTILS